MNPDQTMATTIAVLSKRSRHAAIGVLGLALLMFAAALVGALLDKGRSSPSWDTIIIALVFTIAAVAQFDALFSLSRSAKIASRDGASQKDLSSLLGKTLFFTVTTCASAVFLLAYVIAIYINYTDIFSHVDAINY